MDLIFLNSDFSLATAPVDTYASAVFTLKYYANGTFSVIVKKDLYSYIKDAAFIYNTDDAITGMIDSIDVSSSITVTGRLLEAMMDDRVINDAANISGQVETVVRAMVTKYAITGVRAIPTLLLGTAAGHTTAVKAQPKPGTALSAAIRELISPLEITYKMTYSYISGGIRFTLYKGKDRTQDQTTNSWAVFSADFENLLNTSYKKNQAEYKNYAYVVADDNVHGRVAVEIDQIASGDIRREIYVDASSISSTDDAANVMSLTDYTAAITAYGTARLAELAATESVEGEAADNAALVYGVNYSLGDLCDIALPDIGITTSARITEVDIVYENGSRKIVPRFGGTALSLKEYIKREMK